MKKIYIIHGWAYNLDKWTELEKSLKLHDIEPIFLKVPGLTEPSSKVWDIDGYIEWLDNKLKNEKDPVVVGHSNGGRIALSYIQQHPGHISRLILIDSAGIAHNEKRSRAKLKTLKALAKIGKPLGRIPPAKKVFYKVIGAQDYYNAPPNMRETMRNMLAADQKINLETIKLPVTIIWGRNDTITPISDGQKMQAELANSTLKVIDGARHAPFHSHAAKVADLIVAAMKD